ncbi:CusA/CzcA family heavy metal efflux RND transporter [Parapedobacter koreensis]|uniref:Cobalt-zinc-cadmium resistance protein CzcA n=1 Tax=Parapedobacter koreensis TaxID=332977 RepID=A0A1H7F6L3_9SPHI|nr:CusA/CzcA family heavy metal efflux RND transporter [Parapedobacter koreensis]SEK19620.1 cobalt-zinc-cadmium resistance protein CzcA [Parapedobacter koreensis]
MLNKIIGFSIQNKLIIGLFTIALILWGGYEATRLPIDALPDITDNQVQVLTVSPSLGAPDVERLITFPIEQACSSIPGLRQIRSFSRFGLSLVTVVFDQDTDLYWARQQISERLQQVTRDLPEGIGTPDLAPVSTGLGEIYQYVVRPLPGYEKQYSAMELRTIQDWIVRRRLLGTPGVADVSSFGGHLKQYEIAIRQDRLKAHGMGITDLFDALERNNQNTGGAYIEKGPTVLYIRSEGLTGSLEDIGDIVVKTQDNGMPLLVRNVATVGIGSAIRYGAMTYNDQGEVAGAVVMMLKGENAANVVKRIKERVAEIQQDLPEGVTIEPFLDRTKMVDNAISTVETNLIEGALIVVFVLVFFLGSLRAGLIVSSVIPLSMLFAIILMNRFGVGGNLMSLGAIDFGLIVDGSVIVVEAIMHRLSHSKLFRGISRISQQDMDREVGHSAGHTIKSAVFSQIIILIVYLPILSLQGIEGKMFQPMALTIAFAILGAFVLSVTYVPMMSALFLQKKLNHKQTAADRMMTWLERRYQPLLRGALSRPKAIILTVLALFALSLWILRGMGGEFIPEIEEGDFAVETRLLTGASLNNTIRTTQQASGILLEKFPEVEKIVTKIGSAEIPTDPMPLEAGDMVVILKDKKEWTSAASFPELADRMTEELRAVPGITVGFQFPVQMRFNELMTGARQDVVCKIFGENLDSLTHYAHRLNRIIQTVPGAINSYEETVTGMPQVVIRYDRKAMATYGLDVGNVNRVVNTAFAGQSAGQVFEGERRFDMVVRLEGEIRKSINDIRNLLVTAANGQQIPLSHVASVVEEEGVNQIQREDTRRRIVLGFNVSGRDVQSIVEELQAKVARQLPLPAGYSIVYGGSFENMNAAKARLGIVVPVALLLIFLLLYFAFNSVKQGLLIYTAIPLSAIGGILALWVRGFPFSISAGVGFIALFGVAVLNGILLVAEFNRLRKEGWDDLTRVVIHATKSKLRAVLMTALVPSLGFIPMAISTGAGGAVQKPLATVVIGGLIVSTLLTLFVLPIFYILFERGFGHFRPKKALLLLIGFFALPLAQAQQPITLNEALGMALSRHPGMEAARLNDAYYRELVSSAYDIGKTDLGMEYGQLNSGANDTRFSISQGFEFPTVYTRQKAVYRAQLERSMAGTMVWQKALEAEVKSVFYELILLQSKKQVLEQADSVYGAFLRKTEDRFAAGDVDILERTTAANQRLQVRAQLEQLLAEEQVQSNRLGFLLQSDKKLLPVADTLCYRNALPVADTAEVRSAPAVLEKQAETILRETALALERSKLLPTIQLGYGNMSIIGWQTDDQGTETYMGRRDRFGAVSVGLGIPIFTGAQHARIRAARVAVRGAEKAEETVRKSLYNQWENLLLQYRQLRGRLALYGDEILPNQDEMLAAASRKLEAGEIDYLQWTLLTNQVFTTKADYLETIRELNRAAIAIEALTAINNDKK